MLSIRHTQVPVAMLGFTCKLWVEQLVEFWIGVKSVCFDLPCLESTITQYFSNDDGIFIVTDHPTEYAIPHAKHSQHFHGVQRRAASLRLQEFATESRTLLVVKT